MSPFDNEGVFGPKTLAVASRAYKDACGELGRTDPNADTAELQHLLAKRILERVRQGERDRHRLRRYALCGIISRVL